MLSQNVQGTSIAFYFDEEPPMADEETVEEVIEPLPTGETAEEHDRIRRSNDLDQQLEREGITSKHNRGYDEAARRASKGKGQKAEGKGQKAEGKGRG
jgi:hypothetical protein